MRCGGGARRRTGPSIWGHNTGNMGHHLRKWSHILSEKKLDECTHVLKCVKIAKKIKKKVIFVS